MSRVIGRSAAFCLHTRPYRENSVIVQLFTRDAGRIACVAKGIKAATRLRRAQSAVLQPFVPLQVEWFGKSELKTLGAVEAVQPVIPLQESWLFAGLYLNEVLNVLLPEQQEFHELYDRYAGCVAQLAQRAPLEQQLRRFEKSLLEQLGYGIPFAVVDREGRYGGEIEAARYYVYVPDSGFRVAEAGDRTQELFLGKNLHAIAAGQFEQVEVLVTAKQLMRQAMAQVLGQRTINSRQLFL